MVLHFVGVDGGGTKTSAVLISAPSTHGQDASALPELTTEQAEAMVRGTGTTGPSNWNSVGVEVAGDNLRGAIRDAARAASVPLAHIAGVCLALSGCDRPEDKSTVHAMLDEMLPGVPLHIFNDAVGALVSGTGGRLEGIVVICGTGTIAYGQHGGREARASGWGPLLGDRGSGYALASEALTACVRAADGRGPHTALLNAVLTALHLTSPEQLIPWAYKDTQWHRFATLAPVVLACAAQGDEVAARIVKENAGEIANAAGVVARKLGIDRAHVPVIVNGGVGQSDTYLQHIRSSLAGIIPHANVVLPSLPASVGAAVLASRLPCRAAPAEL